jgi:hypothetical protein
MMGNEGRATRRARDRPAPRSVFQCAPALLRASRLEIEPLEPELLGPRQIDQAQPSTMLALIYSSSMTSEALVVARVSSPHLVLTEGSRC